MSSKVFLGGTCNNSTWRDELIPLLTIDYFNPVVEDWTPELKAIEDEQKRIFCNIHLYVITKEMTGVYSVAEIIDSAWDMTKECYVQIMPEGFNEKQLKSLEAVANLAHDRGANVIISNNVKDIAIWLNSEKDV
jgi:hypothetical protein